MSSPAQLQLTKLNPTTITIPSLTPDGSILKVACSPYLSIQLPGLATLKAARQNADSHFEVIVPVGGKVEMNLEAEVGCLLGDHGGNVGEFKEEEWVMEEVIQALDRNRSVLDLDGVVTSNTSTVRLHPNASAGHRAGLIEDLIPRDMPIAHLIKIDIKLAWTRPSAPSTKNESQSSSSRQAENEFEFLSSDDEEEDSKAVPLVSNHIRDGQLPDWAGKQLQAGIGKLFRVEMIKRFPLVFDAGLARYIHRITPLPILSTTLNRCLHLSMTHSTPLIDELRDVMNSITSAQSRWIAHRQSQAALLPRRPSGRKRRKLSSDSQPSEESQSTTELNDGIGGGEEMQITTLVPEGTEMSLGETFGEVSGQSLVRIGRERWTSLRLGRGRLSYNRIQLCDDGLTREVRSDDQLQRVTGDDDDDDELIDHAYAFEDMHMSHIHSQSYNTIDHDEFVSNSDLDPDQGDSESYSGHVFVMTDDEDERDEGEEEEEEDEFMDDDGWLDMATVRHTSSYLYESASSISQTADTRLPTLPPEFELNLIARAHTHAGDDNPVVPNLIRSPWPVEPTDAPVSQHSCASNLTLVETSAQSDLEHDTSFSQSWFVSRTREDVPGNQDDDDDDDDLDSLLSFASGPTTDPGPASLLNVEMSSQPAPLIFHLPVIHIEGDPDVRGYDDGEDRTMLGPADPLRFEDGRKLSWPYYDTRDDQNSIHVQDTLRTHERHDSAPPTGGLGRQIKSDQLISDQLITDGESDPNIIYDGAEEGGAQTGSITPDYDLDVDYISDVSESDDGL